MASATDSRTEITLNDLAPNEQVHFSFATAEFDLSGKKIHRTADESVIAEADTHAWLNVKRPEVPESPFGGFREQLAPEDDHLSLLGSPNHPNDPAEVDLAEVAKLEAEGVNVAIDANKDQSEVVVIDGITAETVAADPTSKTSSKTTKDKD